MRTISGVVTVVAMTAILSGCLRQAVTHTIYLGPSGAVWSAIERDVRSDEKLIAAINPSNDKTPTLGRDRSFFEELFNNIGTISQPGLPGSQGGQ